MHYCFDNETPEDPPNIASFVRSPSYRWEEYYQKVAQIYLNEATPEQAKQIRRLMKNAKTPWVAARASKAILDGQISIPPQAFDCLYDIDQAEE